MIEEQRLKTNKIITQEFSNLSNDDDDDVLTLLTAFFPEILPVAKKQVVAKVYLDGS